MSNFELPTGPRLLISAELRPLQGHRFQPTGFPDVGPGLYSLPDGEEHLLVESAQSVANRLESACWDEETQDLRPPLKGLPFVRVEDPEGRFLTASILEAHRLNSVYIEKSNFFEELKKQIDFDDKRPYSREKLITALAKYDIGCLIHGVFLESIAGVLRIPRALSGFIEAERVNRVQSGGVKNDRVQATKDAEGGKTAAEGFGNVPFQRTEFVAEKITAYFNLDLEQIRGYRLGPELSSLLYALALYKIHGFLGSGLRLRTACDLEVASMTERSGRPIPSMAEVEKELPKLIAGAGKKGAFASPAVTKAQYSGVEPKKGKK